MLEKNYYTYVYLDPRKPGKFVYENYQFDYEPFYVGKGRGWRAHVHLWEAKSTDEKNITNHYKVSKMKKILKMNMDPILFFVQENLSEEGALALEEKLIMLIKRKEDGGPLTNICSSGRGTPGWHNSTKGKTFNEIYGGARAQAIKQKFVAAIQEQKKDPRYHDKRKEIVKKSVATKKSDPEWSKRQAEVLKANLTPEVILRRATTQRNNYKKGKYSQAAEIAKLKGLSNGGVGSPGWKGWHYDPQTNQSFDSPKTASRVLGCSKETIRNWVRSGRWLLLDEPKGIKILGEYLSKEDYLKVKKELPENVKKWVYPD